MTRVLVLYYSSYGHIRSLAEAEAEGARSVAGTTVDIRRVPETVPQAVRESAGYREDFDTPVARVSDLPGYDAIIFGTPTRFGMMAAQMKQFFDMAGGLKSVAMSEDGKTLLKVDACFDARGFGGLLYWYSMFPFHKFIFDGLTSRLASRARVLARSYG